MDDASALVADLLPSRVQADVLCEASRYEMLADHNERAVELGREALRLADELGLDDIRVKALINVGTARAGIGDAEGFTNLETAIELAKRINLAAEIIRGTNNLEVRHAIAGDFTLARQMTAEIRELAQRYGHLNFVRFIDGSDAVTHPYIMGEWDLAVARADAFLRAVEEGSPHYQAAQSYIRRSLIRLARGDDAGALSDTRRALELARPVGDPQVLLTVLLDATRVYAETGDEPGAAALFDEALTRLRELPHLGFSVYNSPAIAWLARLFGREADAEALFSRETIESRWLDVAKAVLAGDLHSAAEILAEIDVPAFEAFYRLRAADAFVAEGRRAEADEQLRAALAFYRGVGATRYVREGEALVAASG